MDDISKPMAEAAGRTYRGATIAWNGGMYDFESPNPEIITLEDMAYALAFTTRWRGQTWWLGKRAFYGVAQHCVFGAEEMLWAGHNKEDALAFLMHEDDEVVLPDFPGPIKKSVPGLSPLAKLQGDAIRQRFGIPPARDPDLIKTWDIRMLMTEKRDLLIGHEADRFHNSDRRTVTEDEFPPFVRRIVPYPHPTEAAERFLRLYAKLGGER